MPRVVAFAKYIEEVAIELPVLPLMQYICGVVVVVNGTDVVALDW